MDIYVINLDRSQDRMLEFRRLNSHIPGIHRFSAVDGNTIDRQYLVETNVIAQNLPYTNGAIGCALSHLFFWEAAISQKTALTVCEDDSIFHKAFAELAPSLLRTLPTHWDLVLWGWNFDSILLFDLIPGVSPCLATFNQDQMRIGAMDFQSSAISPKAFRLFRAFGTVCYTISPQGASRLLNRSLPLRPLTVSVPMINPAFPNNGIDIVMNAAYPDLNAYVSVPPLVLTKNEHSISTVQSG